jgi:1,4-alpha-glucan branching enzyme
MNADHAPCANERYSARNSLRPINFYCAAPGATLVQIAGDFNHWHPLAMRQREDGWWFIQVLLGHGHHEYHFIVDGRPVLDPQASGTTRDQRNEPVSLIAVS